MHHARVRWASAGAEALIAVRPLALRELIEARRQEDWAKVGGIIDWLEAGFERRSIVVGRQRGRVFGVHLSRVVDYRIRVGAIARCVTRTRSTYRRQPRRRSETPVHQRRTRMLLATTTIEDFDRFNNVFSTKGAEKRKQHGSKGALVFRDPNEDDRVWVIFDWDLDSWQNFASDPEVPPIMQEAGHRGSGAVLDE